MLVGQIPPKDVIVQYAPLYASARQHGRKRVAIPVGLCSDQGAVAPAVRSGRACPLCPARAAGAAITGDSERKFKYRTADGCEVERKWKKDEYEEKVKCKPGRYGYGY
jgi:hypothetical protein